MSSANTNEASDYTQLYDKLIDALTASKKAAQKEKNGNISQGEVITRIAMDFIKCLEKDNRETTKKKQADGIAAAKARGVHMGRPVKKSPDNFIILAKQWENGNLSINEFMKQTGMKERTLYRRLQEHSIKKKK